MYVRNAIDKITAYSIPTMKKILFLLTFLAAGLYSCGQNNQVAQDTTSSQTATPDSTSLTDEWLGSPKDNPSNYIYSDTTYTDTLGRSIRIQNSFPKGGGVLDLNSFSIGFQPFDTIPYGHAILWTRIINESNTPLALNVNFPADSLAIFPASPESHLKLFLPPGTMTLDKVGAYSYGIAGLESFLVVNFYQPGIIERTIGPGEDLLFYVALLSHIPNPGVDTSPRRTALVLDGESLYYRISTTLPSTYPMPCGELFFKE